MKKGNSLWKEFLHLSALSLILPLSLYLLTKGTHPFGAMILILVFVAPLIIFLVYFVFHTENTRELIWRFLLTNVIWGIYWIFAWQVVIKYRMINEFLGLTPSNEISDGAIFILCGFLGYFLIIWLGRNITKRIIGK